MKKKLMIDMDDVICNGGFLHLVNKFTNKNYTLNDFEKYFLQDIIPETKKEEWINFFANNNMYERACFIGSAFETIKKLNEQYEIFIVTAYLIKDGIQISGGVLEDKFNWLQKELPFINPCNYVFTDNKDIIDCDIKIDDKLSNLTGNAKIKLLFTAYHNKNLTDKELNKKNIKRIHTWEEIADILL
ncbi:MAG: hypothetical protein PHD15_05370 [Clostridia bacterium]|nr:hypothetical protein [Clostridia bacterium]MDD4387165.1 hypothetical protein [Clostridia bacterium]